MFSRRKMRKSTSRKDFRRKSHVHVKNDVFVARGGIRL